MKQTKDARMDYQQCSFELAVAYDLLRLETYRRNVPDRSRLDMRQIGSALALRFTEVGYFNRAYAVASDDLDLAALATFYRDSPHGCELILSGGCPPPTRDELSAGGWRPSSSYSWLAAGSEDLKHDTRCTPPDGVIIRSPEQGERASFCETYLEAFAAPQARRAAATNNLRLLFDRPELRFLMVLVGDKPVAVGMTYQQSESFMLCAGATVPQHRCRGIHSALIAARLRCIRDSGGTLVVSWARHGGQSQTNMERWGLRTVGVSQAWQLPGSAGGM